MTSHKPFTAEELDGFMHREATVEDFERLIAQAREEIRLRKMLDGQTFVLTGPPEDPAARAKRELGEWLVADDSMRRRALWTADEAEGEHPCLVLFEPRQDLEDAMHIGRGATRDEAITAALRVAKGEKP